MHWSVILLIILAGALVLAVLGGTWFFFDYAVRRKPRHEGSAFPPDSPWGQVKYKMDSGKSWIRAHTLIPVKITSYDGLSLNGNLLEVKGSSKTVLMMHGFRSQDHDDFCTSVKYFYESGYNVLLADQRAHGESEGKYLCFGIKERYDCRDWINFIEKRYGPDSSLVLMGVSMGCATVLMALGFQLPPIVKGVIADCGYTSPKDIFKFVIKNSYHLPSFPILNLCGLLCRYVAGFSIDEYSTKEALKNNRIPVLFIHGGKDNFVPSFMTLENCEACRAPKELFIVDKAEHAMSFLRDTQGCWAAISKFLNKYGC